MHIEVSARRESGQLASVDRAQFERDDILRFGATKRKGSGGAGTTSTVSDCTAVFTSAPEPIVGCIQLIVMPSFRGDGGR